MVKHQLIRLARGRVEKKRLKKMSNPERLRRALPYKITPQDHTSALRPSYFSPWNRDKMWAHPISAEFAAERSHAGIAQPSDRKPADPEVNLPGWLQDTRSEVSRTRFPAWSPSAAAKPSRSRRFWCCSCRRAANFQAERTETDWKLARNCGSRALINETNFTFKSRWQIECEWQKSNADIIWRKNLRASLGVSRPFFTR